MTHACPECGTPVSERAAVCPQCGFPLRRDAFHPPPGTPPGYAAHPPPPPPRSGLSPGVLIAAIVGVGVVGVFVIGVLAAIAIPRFSQAVAQAREAQGEEMLREVWVKEREYRDQNGSYASTLHDLRSVGWTEPPDSAAYALLVISSERGNLCIEAEPRTAGGTLSVRDEGVVLHAGCGEQTASEAGAQPSDETIREEGRLLLQDSWEWLRTYHEAHGRYPRDASEVADGGQAAQRPGPLPDRARTEGWRRSVRGGHSAQRKHADLPERGPGRRPLPRPRLRGNGAGALRGRGARCGRRFQPEAMTRTSAGR